MKFRKLLEERKAAIVKRWLADVLATYPDDASAVFKRQKDPFANPIGHSLREGTREILDALCSEADCDTTKLDKIREHLHEIVKIRAVQEFSASHAVRFVFQLKDAVRAELAAPIKGMTLENAGGKDSQLASDMAKDLAKLEGQVDEIALAAFDIFVKNREQVYELRVNEAKRRVSWVIDKLNKRGIDPDLSRVNNG